MVYHRVSNETFRQRPESFEHSAAISITGTIKGTLYKFCFEKLGLETLKSRHWLRKLCLFYELIKEKSSAYLFPLILENSTSNSTRIFKNVKSLSLGQKPTFSKIIFLLQLYWSETTLMLISVTQLVVMFLKKLY